MELKGAYKRDDIKLENGKIPSKYLNSSSGSDSRVDWMLSTSKFEPPSIVYTPVAFEINTTGELHPLVTSGTLPISDWIVSSGAMPSFMNISSVNGYITYDTNGVAVSSGSFGVSASNPAGQSGEYIINWSVSAGNGIAEYTNSEKYYPAMRISVSGYSTENVLIKLDNFAGETTSIGDGTLISDATKPVWVASHGDSWDYMISVQGFSYWLLFQGSSTDPAALSNGASTDIAASSLGYSLVCPHSDDITFKGVNYPADQTDVHYLTRLDYLSLGNDVSLNGFLGDNTDWSYGFTLVDEMPEDGLGRIMFSREGRNWIGFYLGHNSVYTNILVGNGSNKSYSSEVLHPEGGFPVGTDIRVTGDNGTIKIYADNILYFSKSSRSYLDNSSASDSLDVLFGIGIESNLDQTSYSYFHGLWQGVISDLWISNGIVEGNVTGIPASATHSWALNETTGKTFANTVGGVDIVGKTASV